MNRDTALTVLLALLAVLALGAAAATLDSAVRTDDGGGFGAGDRDGRGVGDSDDGDLGVGDGGKTELAPIAPCVPELRSPPALLVLFALFAVLFGLTYRDTGSAFAGAVVCSALAIPVGLLYALVAFCHADPGTAASISLGFGGNDSSILPRGGGATGIGGETDRIGAPTAAFGLLLFFALAASAALLLAGSGDDDATDSPGAADGEVDRSDVDVAALGRAAGDAADRIEGGTDVENEVFRAWRTMTDRLDVDSPSTTPAEFAAAAVEAGLDPEDVSELTALFEEVRYGGASPTPEREARAVAALRRIERTHAGGSGGDA